jgi:threonine dehydrogenase-like Zn-dependent dehydrogenase
MHRLIITGPRQAVFEDVARPECPPDGVLVEACTTAISAGTEIRVFRAIPVDEDGQFLYEKIPFAMPTENGYSMVGTVMETGEQVEAFDIGERVFATAPHRHIAALQAARVTQLPNAIPDKEAVFLNILEVAHKAIRVGDPQAGANVVIVGQGVVGLSLLAYSVAFGWRTAVVDLAPGRLEIARQMGAGLAVSTNDADHSDQIFDYFGGAGADVAFEAGSNWSAIRTAMELTRTDGRVVIVSRHTQKPDFNPVGHPFLGKRLSLATSYAYPPDGARWDYRTSINLTIDLLARRRLYIEPMITHQFDWQQLPEVYRRLDQGDQSIVGAVINWRKDQQ